MQRLRLLRGGLPVWVLDQRKGDGRAWKCTLCYDRLGRLEPACAKACPTDSIQFGAADELRERAALRVEKLHAAGFDEACLYGGDAEDGIGGFARSSCCWTSPRSTACRRIRVSTTRRLGEIWKSAGLAAGTIALAVLGAFQGPQGEHPIDDAPRRARPLLLRPPRIKQPVWKPEVPWYFFTGGLGGASTVLALVAGLVRNQPLARRSWLLALTGFRREPACC